VIRPVFGNQHRDGFGDDRGINPIKLY